VELERLLRSERWPADKEQLRVGSAAVCPPRPLLRPALLAAAAWLYVLFAEAGAVITRILSAITGSLICFVAQASYGRRARGEKKKTLTLRGAWQRGDNAISSATPLM